MKLEAGAGGIRSVGVGIPWNGCGRAKDAAVFDSETAVTVRTDDLFTVNEVTGITAAASYAAAADVIARDIAGTEYVPACDAQSGIHGL